MTQKTGEAGGIQFLNSQFDEEDQSGRDPWFNRDIVFYEEVAASERAADAYEAEQNDLEAAEIRVGCTRSFPMRLWREAILFYLNGAWAGAGPVSILPLIDFGDVALAFRTDNERYTVISQVSPRGRFDRFSDALQVSDLRADVENGLVRFVKDNQIRQLAIVTANDKVLRLSKHTSRSQLSVDFFEGWYYSW